MPGKYNKLHHKKRELDEWQFTAGSRAGGCMQKAYERACGRACGHVTGHVGGDAP